MLVSPSRSAVTALAMLGKVKTAERAQRIVLVLRDKPVKTMLVYRPVSAETTSAMSAKTAGRAQRIALALRANNVKTMLVG